MLQESRGGNRVRAKCRKMSFTIIATHQMDVFKDRKSNFLNTHTSKQFKHSGRGLNIGEEVGFSEDSPRAMQQ